MIVHFIFLGLCKQKKQKKQKNVRKHLVTKKCLKKNLIC